MRKITIRCLTFTVVLLIHYSIFTIQPLCAFMSSNDAGTSTAQFLKLGAGARATALGNAFTGISDDATAVYWNPAGLNQIDKASVSLMHAIWFDGIYYDWASYVQPTKIGTFGVGVQYLSYGSITQTDNTGLDIGSFSPNDTAGTVSYANKIGNVMLGVNLKYISSKITNTATAYAGDIGIMYKLLQDKLTLAAVGQNIGTKMKFVNVNETLPMDVKVGGAYKIKDNWLVALDLIAPNDNALTVGGGTEYTLKISKDINIAGRVGYNTENKDTGGLHGLTAGLGGTYNGYELDYAFVPFGDLGDTHRISLGIKF